MHQSMAAMHQGIKDMHQAILSLAHANSLSHAQAIQRIDQLAAQVFKDSDSRAYRAYSWAYGAYRPYYYRACIPARCPGMLSLAKIRACKDPADVGRIVGCTGRIVGCTGRIVGCTGRVYRAYNRLYRAYSRMYRAYSRVYRAYSRVYRADSQAYSKAYRRAACPGAQRP